MTSKVFFEGELIPCQPDKTLLQNLLNYGVVLPFGCCQGRCGACKLQATGSAPIPPQDALFPSECGKSLLVCDAFPPESGELYLSEPIVTTRYQGTIISKQRVTDNTLRLTVEGPGAWEAGQFVQLYRTPSIYRCYSFANVPNSRLPNGITEKIFHVRLREEGALSRWLNDDCHEGDALEYGLAQGQSWQPESSAPVLLVGTGTGIAPLLSIAHAQLQAFPETPLLCLWAMPNTQAFYCWDEWQQLMALYPQVACVPVVRQMQHAAVDLIEQLSDVSALNQWLRNKADHSLPPACWVGDLNIALNHIDRAFFSGQSRVALAGNPKTLATLSRALFLKGVSTSRLHLDAFESQQT